MSGQQFWHNGSNKLLLEYLVGFLVGYLTWDHWPQKKPLKKDPSTYSSTKKACDEVEGEQVRQIVGHKHNPKSADIQVLQNFITSPKPWSYDRS